MAPEVHEFTQSTSFALENIFISSSNAFTLGPKLSSRNVTNQRLR